MGMYNEVYCRCPECGGTGYCQVSQYVIGFGEFNLHEPASLMGLTLQQLQDLYNELADSTMHCQKCGHQFNPYSSMRSTEYVKALNKLIIK